MIGGSEVKKENKYDHVGRPTNEEVKARKNKTLLKVGCGLALVLVAIFGIAFSINNSNLTLLKGSSTNFFMKKVQTNSKIKRVVFRPDYINADKTLYSSKKYYENFYSAKKAGNNYLTSITLSQYLFDLAGFGVNSGYAWNNIYIYYNGNYISKVGPNQTFTVKSKYLGKTLALKLVAKKGGKKFNRYLRLYVPSALKTAPRCTIRPTKRYYKDSRGNHVIQSFKKSVKSVELIEGQFIDFSIKCDSYSVGFADVIPYSLSNDAIIVGNKRKGKGILEVVDSRHPGGSKDGRYIYYSATITQTGDFKEDVEYYFGVRPFRLKNKKDVNAVESNRIKVKTQTTANGVG